jgi:hypothetical protein
MRRASSRRVLVIGLLLVVGLLVPVSGAAADVPPPDVVLESLEALAEQGADGRDATGDASIGAQGRMEAAVDSAVSTSEPAEAPIPFSMIGFTLPAGVDEVEFRTLGPDGWTAWAVAEALGEDDGPDPDTDEARAAAPGATDPHWVGEAHEIQIRVEGAKAGEVGVHVIDSVGLSESLVAKAARHLRARPAPAEASAGPSVVTRAQWRARAATSTHRTIAPRYAVVHHTAGSNNYTRDESPAVVRGIQAWHMDHNKWADIGYNFLVDRYGTIYEGRAGSLDRGIQGAHAAGHNADSFGVSLMGNFDVASPPAVAIDRLVDVIAWQFDRHGIDPSATVMGAGTNNRTIPSIVGHRDVGSTACPGRYVVSQMGSIRDRVTVRVKAGGAWHAVTGDWNGDGRHTPGWFNEGNWYVQTTTSAGSVSSFRFGGAGDVPLVGDWNGNGQYGIGIVRDGRWHLRQTPSGGTAQLPIFTYGRVTQGDVPITGDWNGNGRYGIGIVRDGRWHLRQTPSGGTAELPVFTFGRVLQGDIPITGDWNRNGRYGIGIVRDGRWHLRHTPSGGAAQIEPFTFGRVSNGDQPVTGDWNRDGRHGVGIARGSEWHLRNTLSGGSAEVFYSFSY